MSLLSRYLDDAYVAWLGSMLGCCASKSSEAQAPMRDIGKPMVILHTQQPHLIPPPLSRPQSANQSRPHTRSASQEWLQRTKSFASRASSRGSFSVRRKLNAYNGPRQARPRISSPSDFRHVQQALPPRKTENFRPLELSIYMPDNRLSAILPHVDGRARSYSCGVEVRDSYGNGSGQGQGHVRSNSAMSNYSIRRKPLASHSVTLEKLQSPAGSPEMTSVEKFQSSLNSQELIAALEATLPQAPPAARLRANTMPVLHEQFERVKSIIQEREELERRLREVDDLISERQSVYMKSRPTSIYAESSEPMPDLSTSALCNRPIRALSSKPSTSLSRPKTAPPRPTVHIPVRAKSFDEASSAFIAPQQKSATTPLLPPLPLVLPRPPLRKKKSFSRVSSWLFPGKGEGEHGRNISIDSITNTPKPVTSREGFYKCVDTGMASYSPEEEARNAWSRESAREKDLYERNMHSRQESVSTVETMTMTASTLDGPGYRWGNAGTETDMSSPCSREELVRMNALGGEKESEVQRLGVRVSRVGVAF